MRKLIAEIFVPGTRVDGTVAALAERRQVYRVLTTDRRDLAPSASAHASRALERLPSAGGLYWRRCAGCRSKPLARIRAINSGGAPSAAATSITDKP